jgi:DNA processing protein
MPTSATCSEIAQQHLRLSMADGVGPILFDRLVAQFGSVEAALAAPTSHLQEVDRVSAKVANAIHEAARSNAWKAEVELAAKLGVRILCREDAGYPEPLRNIPDPPICLYVMGEIRREDALSIAIVGSRQASIYGLEQAQRFAELLSQTGLTVISGMARGIDQAAHMAALRAGGRTLAVLGCGLSLCYPPDSVELRDRIATCGAVISELPLQTAPSTQTFPKRNRIIAGLSLGTLVIEAARRSGALITARVASEYNREVFALPGRVDTPTAMGTNDLISQGFAKLVSNLGDILDALGDVGESLAQYAAGKMLAGSDDSQAGGRSRVAGDAGSAEDAGAPAPLLPQPQAVVYKALTTSPMHMEQVASASGLPIGQVSAALTLLQLKGLVRQLPGNQFARRA